MAHSRSAKNPVNEQRRVMITNNYGEKLVGLLHESGSKEIVVLCHGFKSSKDDIVLVNIAAALEREGISVFRFDFAGFGESEGSLLFADFDREADDIRAVVQHFSGQNRVVSAILGHSKGGSLVLFYASKYHDVRAIVNVSGRYDLKRDLTEDVVEKISKDGYIDIMNKKGGVDFHVTEKDLMNLLTADMHEVCRKISKECRVLMIYGSADKINPFTDALGFAKVIRNHQLHIIEGADHRYTSHQTQLASAVVKFMKLALEQDKLARL